MRVTGCNEKVKHVLKNREKSDVGGGGGGGGGLGGERLSAETTGERTMQQI